MASDAFDQLTDAYDAMIDWPKRLSYEEPFFRRWFGAANARRIADTACGTGRHAAVFHSWGLAVEGSDLSPRMVERARATFGEPAGLRWVVRGFDEAIDVAEPFDVVLCTGNSLALAADVATVERAVQAMLAAVRRGGLVIVHLMNLWRLPDGPVVWQKCRRAALPLGESIVVKGVRRCGTQGYVEMVVALLTDPPQLQTESAVLLGLEAEPLEAMLLQAGAAEVQRFGGYRDEPYRRQESADLVLVARRDEIR
jgi:SAM-dependent methyltransferase